MNILPDNIYVNPLDSCNPKYQLVNCICQAQSSSMLFLMILQEKRKPETSKEPQYIPNYIPVLEQIDPDYWMKLFAKYKDLFGEIDALGEWGIKH